jgi:hypothetical protein
MSRISSGSEQIIVKPTNNVYTVLVAVAIVVEIIGFISLWMQSTSLYGASPFSQEGNPQAVVAHR